MFDVRFFGVRGSTPCGCAANRRYGGNTSCVALTDPQGEHAPIVFDLGTGLRFFGETQPTDGSFACTVLLSHLHWDHVQGLPFFVPIDRPGARMDLYGPVQEHGTLIEALEAFMCPPYFPIHVTDLRGDITFNGVADTKFDAEGATVTVGDCPHIGPTNGYRVERDGVSVAYLPDHQAPYDLASVAGSILELCADVDLLIHDAQYTDAEWEQKAHWGHCTVDYAVKVAVDSGARRLALFHHDPARDDTAVDEVLARAQRLGEPHGLEVFAAAEGQTVRLG